MVQTDSIKDSFYSELRAIVADGSLHIRSVLRAMLGGLGVAEIVDADTMEIALQKLELDTFDLLIVDEQLPPYGAVGLVKNIRALGSQHARLAPIMTSARPTVQCIAQARKAGIEEIITKPFSVADLDARIKRCVAARRNAPEAPKRTRPKRAPAKAAKAAQPPAQAKPAAEEQSEREIVYI